MTSYFSNLKLRFLQKDLLIRLILINIAVFLLFGIVMVISTLFKLNWFDACLNFVAVPADLHQLLTHPWTLFTYMFAHYSIWHILFNMLVLYWFGQLFLDYFTQRNLGSLYLLGGLSGALLYIIAFNTIPYYIDLGYSTMVGASASVTAILFASAFYNPQRRINLFIFGSVKILYIALFIFILDFLSLASDKNPGGGVAHIGGAIIGYIFAVRYRNGYDITRWIGNILDFVANIFKPKTKLKVKKANKREADYQYNQRKHNESEEIDHILDKIRASGYGSLTKDEKKKLFDASNK